MGWKHWVDTRSIERISCASKLHFTYFHFHLDIEVHYIVISILHRTVVLCKFLR